MVLVGTIQYFLRVGREKISGSQCREGLWKYKNEWPEARRASQQSATRKERRALFAGEALEVGHLAFHLFARGVGGRADALNTEFEFVGVGSAGESFFEGDELTRVEVEERLVESLHAVLAGAGGNGIVNQARLIWI